MIESEISDRGFKHYAEFGTSYGHKIRVYESSSVEPSIWMKIDSSENTCGDVKAELSVHLSWNQAEKLIETLTTCLENHYQRRADDRTHKHHHNQVGRWQVLNSWWKFRKRAHKLFLGHEPNYYAFSGALTGHVYVACRICDKEQIEYNNIKLQEKRGKINDWMD